MNSPKTPRSLFIFHLLVIYVFIQFAWWAYLLLTLNNKVYVNSDELHIRWLMIAGEGAVFLSLMIAGITKIRSNFKKEAAAASQQRNFLLAVTHELKSPLASIRLMFETIQKRELEKGKLKEIASNGIKDTERLNSLVENILLTTQFENNTNQLRKEISNFSEYIKSTLDKLIPVLAAQRKVITSIDENIFLPIDRLYFQSIISNLLENAVKYSEENATITIRLSSDGHKAILSFADEGSGISEEEKNKIFMKFYRVGNEAIRRTKGTGLGLYIVKQLVEKHHGTITVKNNFPKGSIFEIAFNLN